MRVFAFAGGAYQQNTFLAACDDGRAGVLVDPGAATGDALAAARSHRLDVAAILLTHAHVDHVEGLAHAKRATGAPVHLHPAERPIYDWSAGQLPVRPPSPDADLQPGAVLEFGGSEFRVAFAPGHSPGHVLFACEAASAAFVGDVVFLGSIGRTDLPGGDYHALMKSIRSEVLTLPSETTLHPGHGPDTTVARERTYNPFLASHGPDTALA